MSRRVSFSRAVATGLLNTGFNTVYTLASVPLALAYLNTSEFGLWVIVAQIVVYLSLLEPCLSGSISRTLISEETGTVAYNQALIAGFAACTLQGLIIIGIGAIISPWLPHWLDVPSPLSGDFKRLYFWQLFSVGIASIPRMFCHVLVAKQRQDIVNNALSVSFVAMYVVQWIGFVKGAGIFSLLWASLAGIVINSVLPWLAASQMKLLPRALFSTPFSRARFIDLIRFAGELALQVIGWHLIAGTHIFFIKIFAGLEAAGIFAVCIKTATLVQAIMFRILDYSVPGLSHMAAQGERARLERRFMQLVRVSAAIAAVSFVLFACLNQPFIAWWTRGEVGWSQQNDWLLAGLFFVYSITRANGTFCWIVKRPELIRNVYLLEGVAVLVGGTFVTPILGVPGLLGMCILLNILFSGVLGATLLGSAHILPRSYLASSVARPLTLFLLFGFVAAGWSVLWRDASPPARFLATALPLVPLAMYSVWRYGIPDEVRAELRAVIRVRLPRRLRK
jgi:O-antigen/teichoic acid export membrane protein